MKKTGILTAILLFFLILSGGYLWKISQTEEKYNIGQKAPLADFEEKYAKCNTDADCVLIHTFECIKNPCSGDLAINKTFIPAYKRELNEKFRGAFFSCGSNDTCLKEPIVGCINSICAIKETGVGTRKR